MSENVIEVRDLTKKYGQVVALNNISFEIPRGELFTIIGPSGCGKTTLLRTIVGLTEPDSGSIRINGKDVKGVPTRLRDVSLVFQNLALFPHKNVYENIAFGLRMRKYPEEKVRSEVESALKTVGLHGVEGRYPRELSMGEQQRIALARSLVIKPSVILFDEPLGNVDYRLRKRLELELKLLHRRLGLTFVYVTHDQEQAMTLATRIMVMNQGMVEQVGSPEEVYLNPATVFVAKFFGEINMLPGEVKSIKQEYANVSTDVGMFKAKVKRPLEQERIVYSIRPEKVTIGKDALKHRNRVKCEVVEVLNKGTHVEYLTTLPNNAEFKVLVEAFQGDSTSLKAGSETLLGWDDEGVVLIEKASVVPGIDIDRVILGI